MFSFESAASGCAALCCIDELRQDAARRPTQRVRRRQWSRPLPSTGARHREFVSKDHKKVRFNFRFRGRRFQRETIRLILAFLISSISGGTISNRLPTMPISLTSKIGASLSLLMAMMVRAPFMPTMCWMAPLMPSAR